MQAKLSIVIPAFRRRFLKRALESIALQSDQRFRVYVGDDASPEFLEALVESVGFGENQLVYHRFESNLGSSSLVKQWERCIDLSDEPWVWLFSDDDVMEPECVANFYAAIGDDKDLYDLYRFNTIVIDGDDRLVSLNPKHPEWETWNEFAYFLLRGLRIANQQELIFRRSEYKRIGGFLNLPLAWGSDHAFAIACGKKAGIRTIKSPGIKFRQSGDNFSSRRCDETDRLKWRANAGYVKWLLDLIRTTEISGFPDQKILETLAVKSYYYGIRSTRKWINISEGRDMISFIREHLGDTACSGMARLAYYNALSVGELVRSRVGRLFEQSVTNS